MRNLLIAVVAALGLVGTTWAAEPAKAPEVKVVETEGSSAISNDDVPMAKEKARNDALRQAVNQAVGTYITSFSEVKDNTMVQDWVGSHTTGYVREYKVIGEEVKDGVAKVKVRAEVSTAEMDKDATAIKTLLFMKAQKKVFVMIADSSTEAVGAKGGAQAVAVVRHGAVDGRLREALRKDGFTCIDPNVAEGKLRSKAGVQSITNPHEANEVAKLVNADLVIYGNVNITTTENDGMGAKIYMATARSAVTVTSTDSAEALTDVTDSFSYRGLVGTADSVDKVSKQSAEKLVKDIRMALFDAWRKQASGSTSVQLTITGIKDLGTLNAFKAVLREQVRGVKEISSSKLEKGGTGLMQVSYAGSTETLANDLNDKVIKGFKTKVNSYAGSTVELELTK